MSDFARSVSLIGHINAASVALAALLPPVNRQLAHAVADPARQAVPIHPATVAGGARSRLRLFLRFQCRVFPYIFTWVRRKKIFFCRLARLVLMALAWAGAFRVPPPNVASETLDRRPAS